MFFLLLCVELLTQSKVEIQPKETLKSLPQSFYCRTCRGRNGGFKPEGSSLHLLSVQVQGLAAGLLDQHTLSFSITLGSCLALC